MPAIYIFVYYDAGLYADFGINIYYLGAAVYGWMMWKYGSFVRQKLHLHIKKEGQQELLITRMPMKYYPPLGIVFAVTFVPWLDSFTTALSIVGMWMLARKYVEQWWAWIVVDIVSAGLYVYKDLNFTAGLYALYTIIAIFGYFKWKRMMERVVE